MSLYLIIVLAASGLNFGMYDSLSDACEANKRMKGKQLVLKITQPGASVVCSNPFWVGGDSITVEPAVYYQNSGSNGCEAVQKKIRIERIQCERFRPPSAWREVRP